MEMKDRDLGHALRKTPASQSCQRKIDLSRWSRGLLDMRLWAVASSFSVCTTGDIVKVHSAGDMDRHLLREVPNWK